MTDAVNPTAIAAYAGDTPDPADPSTYGTRGRALWAWETDVLLPGANVLATQAYTNALAALESAQVAYLNANYKGAWASLTGALNMPAVVSHAGDRWTLNTNLADVTLKEPGVDVEWDLYEFPSSFGIAHDPTGTGLTATTVKTAIEELYSITVAAELQALAGRNLIRNRDLLEVNRSRAWGYPHALGAGVFIIDCWRAGAGGVTITSGAGGGTLNIGAGTAVQTVFVQDGVSAPDGTEWTIAWDGTAQARIDGGAYSASPITFAPGTSPASFELEVGTGTFSKPRVHAGSYAPVFVPQDVKSRQIEADFEYKTVWVYSRYYAGAAAAVEARVHYVGPMRSGTVGTLGTPDTSSNVSGTPSILHSTTSKSVRLTIQATAVGNVTYDNSVFFSSGV